MFGTIFDKYKEKKYWVDDEDGQGLKQVYGIRHRNGLAIRKRDQDHYAIDIIEERWKLYDGLKSSWIAKSIIEDEFIQRFNWKLKGARSRTINFAREFKELKERYNPTEKPVNQQKPKNNQQQQQQKPKNNQQQQNKQQQQKPKNNQQKQNNQQQNNKPKQQQQQQKKQNNNHQNHNNEAVAALMKGQLIIKKYTNDFSIGYKVADQYKMMVRNISTQKNAEKVKKHMMEIYDWEKYGYPLFFDHANFTKEYLKQVVSKVERGQEIEELRNVDVIIEFFFAMQQKITSRYPVYYENIQELRRMTGLKKVKEQIRELALQLVGRMKRGLDRGEMSMHMIFSGPPGTGKTVVARNVSNILYALGYLEEQKIVETSRGDLVAEYIGQTAVKTKQRIEEAIGGVLFIDEAYDLYRKGSSNDFGIEAVNTLIKEMEDRRTEFVVIMAGYEKDMEELIKMNPGFKSRISNNIEFEPYKLDELMVIAKSMEQKILNTHIQNEGREYLKKVVDKKMTKGYLEGNARDLRTIMEKISKKYNADATFRKGPDVVTVEDIRKVFPLEEQEEKQEKQAAKVMEKLNSLYGLHTVKQTMDIFAKKVQWEKRMKEVGGVSNGMNRMHMVFMGPSGTGKTTVAKIMSEFLVSVGVLKSDKVVVATRKDLVAEYVGQTATKTKEKIEEAMGGVLFIDEAYSLVNGPNDTFGDEAVTELIAAMEEYKDEFIVILAGYEKDMEKLLATNEGFNSRISRKFVFEDYNAEEIFKILKLKLKQRKYILTREAEETLQKEIFQYGIKCNQKFDGNGRWADNRVENLIDLKVEITLEEDRDIQNMTKEEMLTIGKKEVERLFQKIA